MIHKFTISFFLFFFTSFSVVNSQGIEFFHGTLEEAKIKAQKEQKLIFIDCYTTWCGPCKMLAKFVFTDPELGKFYNENFINMKLDMEAEGSGFAIEYAISAYPTLVFIDHIGTVKKKLVGGRDAKSLIQEGKSAMAPDPVYIRKLEQRFNEGDRETEFLYSYIKLLSKSDKPYEVVLREYLSNLKEEEKNNTKNRALFFEIANHISSISTQQVLSNPKEYKTQFGEKAYEEKMIKIAHSTAQDAAKNRDESMFERSQTFLKNSKVANYKKYQFQNALLWEEAIANWEKYSKTASDYISKYIPKDTAEIYLILSNLEQRVAGGKAINNMLKPTQNLIKLQAIYSHYMLLAKVYLKLGDDAKAMENAQKAINLNSAEDTSEAHGFVERLKMKIKKAK